MKYIHQYRAKDNNVNVATTFGPSGCPWQRIQFHGQSLRRLSCFKDRPLPHNLRSLHSTSKQREPSMEASANITAVTVTADASDRTRAAATRTPISNVGDTMLEHLSNPLQPKAETSSTQRALFTPSLVKTRKSARRESSSGATAQLGIGFDAEAAAANSSSLRVPVDFKSVSNRSSAWRSASVNHSTGSVFDVHTIGTLDAALIVGRKVWRCFIIS